MIKIKLLLVLFLTLTTPIFSQSGTITYSVNISTNDKAIKEDIKETYNKLIEIARTQEFILVFNRTASYFNIQNKLTDKNEYEAKMYKISRSAFTARNEVFTNISEKETIERTYEDILIKKKNDSYAWKITNESKKIDNYLCYKATFEEFFPRRDGTQGSRTITAWFAPSLPYNFGPLTYYGLPGLILELTRNSTTFLASKIEISEKQIPIDFPKGKTITHEEYDNKLKNQMGM